MLVFYAASSSSCVETFNYFIKQIVNLDVTGIAWTPFWGCGEDGC